MAVVGVIKHLSVEISIPLLTSPPFNFCFIPFHSSDQAPVSVHFTPSFGCCFFSLTAAVTGQNRGWWRTLLLLLICLK